MKKCKKVSLVLAGGACKGFMYSGAMRALEDTGFEIDGMWGTSVGTIYEVLITCGYKSNKVDDFIKRNPILLDNMFSKHMTKLLNVFNNKKNKHKIRSDDYGRYLPETGISDTENLKSLLYAFAGDDRFGDYPDVSMITCDVVTGKRIILNHETAPEMKLVKGVLCSAAVPPYYPIRIIEPHEIFDESGKHPEKGTYVTDGGATTNFPLDLPLRDRKCKNIIAIDLGCISEMNRHEIPRDPLSHLLSFLSLNSSYKTRGGIFRSLLERDYDKTIEEGMFKTTYADRLRNRVKGRSKKVLLINPEIDDKYAFKASEQNYKELSEIGYDICIERFREFDNWI